MLRRLIVTGAVAALVLVLLLVQNKVLTGHHELQGELRPLSATAGSAVYELVLRDAAGNPRVVPTEELEDIRLLVERRLAADPAKGLEAIPHQDLIQDAGGSLRLSVPERHDGELLARRVGGKPFRMANEPRELVHVTRGIDIQGGVEFICRLYDERGERVAADEETVGILRGRLDERGLTEPQVTRLSNGDVQIVIPGGTSADAARTRRVLETTGRLEFREVLADYGRVPEGTKTDFPGTEPGQQGTAVVRRKNGGWDFAPGVPRQRGDIVAAQETEPGREPTHWLRLGPVKVQGRDVKAAYQTTQDGSPAVGIEFTAVGAGKNEEFTTDTKRKGDQGNGTGRIAILFDGVVKSDPRVISPSSNTCVITGRFTQDEIDGLKAALRGGSLSVTPQVLSERVVGATLGHQEVERAVTAMLWSLTFIVLFMVAYYRRLGLVAVSSVVVTAALTWTTMSIFGATLTLPGIAGLILSIAMSIDTNVLIYERIREELRGDKGLRHAIQAGYDRAFVTVLDSNLTTVIAGLVLYMIGSGPIKGFGLTLMIGIAISMFSGIYFGRLLTDFLCRGRDGLSLAGWFKEMPLPYVAMRKIAFSITAVTAIGGLMYFLLGHKLVGGTFERNFGIDFTGGVMVQATFDRPLAVAEVEDALAKAEAAIPADQRDASLINDELSKQPYYAKLGETGASRQWVFRTRDDEGTRLERLRHDMELEVSEIRRKAETLRTAEVPDKAGAERIEREELAPKVRELTKLTEQVQGRTAAFKQAIAAAFAGSIRAEGGEITRAAWTDRSLELHLATIDEVAGPQAAEIAKRLPKAWSPVVEPAPGGLLVRCSFAEDPVPAVEAIDSTAQHLLGLLGAPPVGQDGHDAAVGRANAAAQVAERVADIAASQRVAVATPFPSSEQFSGQVAERMKWSALAALFVALVLMLFYIAARFEFAFGVGATVSLLHVILQAVALLALFHIRIDLTVIAGLLTVIGYAINDTIVVYDRIRENLRLMAGKSLEAVIDASVAQTMPRTILTGGGVIIALTIMVFATGDSLKAFNLTLLAGILLGTFSSVFVASPMLLLFRRRIADQLAAEEAAKAAAEAAGAKP